MLMYPLRILIVFLLTIYASLVYSQPNEVSDLSGEGLELYLNGNYADALKKFKQSLSLQEKDSQADKEMIARTYRNMGMCQLELNLLNKAQQNLDEAIDRYSTIIKNDTILNTRYAFCHRHRARIFLRKGDFTKAIDDSNTAIELFKKINELNNEAAVWNLLANIYIDTQEYERAKECCEIAIAKCQADLDINPLADIYHTLAIINRRQNNYKQAIDNYNNALKFTKNSSGFAKTYNSIGFAYLKMGNLVESESYLNRGLKIKKVVSNNSRYDFSYSATFENFGDLKIAQGDFENALDYYQKSLINLTDDFRNQDINTNPTIKGNHYIYNKPDLLRALDLKAQAALKSDNTDLAYDTYQDLDNWITEFYKDLSTNESKLTWIARAHDMYAHAIEVALKKGNKEKAFQYAEKAHAVLLWQSLSQQAAQSLLSDEEREEMDDLSAEIRQADQQYRNQEISIDKLRSLKREREAIEKQFEEKYPKYKERKYQTEAITVSNVQDIIDNNTAFLEYYLTSEVLYIFTITKDNIEIAKKSAEGLADDISNFVKNISRKDTDAENYHALAYKLYEQLIPNNLQLGETIDRLVIVPDSEIGTLPFAALATQATSGEFNKNTPFLFKKYTTNYLYSAGSYLQLQQKTANQKYCLAGIAPIEYKLKGWADLPNSEGELEGIKSLHWSWYREILMREKATKTAFKDILKESYHTMQVSTHAVFDENGGRIIFYNDSLNQHEIDELEKIEIHRLIFSACETGKGIQNQGEGILSLGWNFAYKGVPSITMTHWKINDYSSQKIMISYHENLNDRMPADEALQKAQLEYLENDVTSNSEYSPYYWAAFFHTGNVR